MQPASITTVSPRPILRSVARPCGFAAFGPEATIASKRVVGKGPDGYREALEFIVQNASK